MFMCNSFYESLFSLAPLNNDLLMVRGDSTCPATHPKCATIFMKIPLVVIEQMQHIFSDIFQPTREDGKLGTPRFIWRLAQNKTQSARPYTGGTRRAGWLFHLRITQN